VSSELRVVIEVQSTRTKEQSATELPGFIMNPLYPPESIRPDDITWGESGFRVHGVVRMDALDRLRHHADVLDVYLDTEIIEFPVSIDDMRAWPLAPSTYTRPVTLHR
jgi:hypothetical protein